MPNMLTNTQDGQKNRATEGHELTKDAGHPQMQTKAGTAEETPNGGCSCQITKRNGVVYQKENPPAWSVMVEKSLVEEHILTQT